jgi:DNA-directed RNA polymerase alpha subunit
MNLTLTIQNVDHARQALGVLQAYIAAHEEAANTPPAPAGSRTPLATLQLSTRASNVLRSVGIETVEELLCWDAYELRRLPNLGPNTLNEITDLITTRGLRLGQPYRRTPIPT